LKVKYFLKMRTCTQLHILNAHFYLFYPIVNHPPGKRDPANPAPGNRNPANPAPGNRNPANPANRDPANPANRDPANPANRNHPNRNNPAPRNLVS
jgi:hypothetical protein